MNRLNGAVAKWQRGSLQNFYARVRFPLAPHMNYQTKSIFVVLGILFLIHGMRLISVEPLPEYGGLGETSFYLPRLSPITSFFTGALLFITILVPRKLFQKLGLSFVVARSFIGLITGILFLITQLLQYGS